MPLDLIHSFLKPLIGGILIGVSASLLLLIKGRILGVSGILAGVLYPKKGDLAWRVASISGLLTAGIVISLIDPNLIYEKNSQPIWQYVIAGLLVGFGTQMGNGCTSGHGVCGVSRFSVRSLVATLTFISSGMCVVVIMRIFGFLK